MNIKFNRDDVRTKMYANMRVAMRCGAVDTAGHIAAVMTSAFHALDRIEANESREVVIDEMVRRHRMLAEYFSARESETCVIEQARLDSMTLEEYAAMRARLESL